MKRAADLLRRRRREIVFLLVGGLNTLVDMGVYTALAWVLVPWAAQGCGYAAGMINSFFMNKYITFQSKKKDARQTVLFFAVTGATLALSMLAMWLLHDKLGWNHFLTKYSIVTPAVMALNYLGYRWIVFKPPGSGEG